MLHTRTILLAIGILLLSTMLTPAAALDTEIEDKDITLALRQQLINDEMVSAHLIDIETIDGIVTLSGTVNHILANDRAAKIAQSLKGVRSVINKLNVVPVSRPDEEIQADIVTALMKDPATEALDILVEVENGQVTLDGTVETWAEKQVAEKVAKGVEGVTAVMNTISFEFPEERSDDEIEAEIERRLELDVRIQDEYLNVDVLDGHVTLSGTVRSAEERAQVYAKSWVTGVEDVDDSAMTINWTPENMQHIASPPIPTDDEIWQSVKDAVTFDPRVASFNVQISVEDGTVTLIGTVESLTAKRAAERDARNTHGVWRVKNYIVVRPPEPVESATIVQDVEDALARDPIVDEDEITVNALNQKVFLYGTVGTSTEKAQAEEIASRVNGVVEVQNSLKVDYDWTWKSDPAIKDDIEEEFFWSLLVDGDHISVSVSGGEATLTGTVSDWTEYYAAIENAFEGGATDVQSYLKVKESPVFGDGPTHYESPPRW